jgi:methylmalonyl-CoA mutase N-terminal domain/subunit
MEIADAAYRYQREIEKDERTIVGVNDFQLKEDKISIPLLEMDPEGERRQFERLTNLRKDRDHSKWEHTLDALRTAASKEDENLMPYILDAVKADGTLGEICGVLREVFGVYEESPLF